MVPGSQLPKNRQTSTGKSGFKWKDKQGEETQTCTDSSIRGSLAETGDRGGGRKPVSPFQILTACTKFQLLCSAPESGEACPGSPWPRGEWGSGGWPACSGTRLARETLERKTAINIKLATQKSPATNSAHNNALGFLSITLCTKNILRKKSCLKLLRRSVRKVAVETKI